MKLAELGGLDRVLVVGSFLRKDHPLVASRLRRIARRKSQINVLHCADGDLLMPVANKAIVRPSEMAETLAHVVKAAAEIKQKPVPAELASLSVGGEAKAIAASLASARASRCCSGTSPLSIRKPRNCSGSRRSSRASSAADSVSWGRRPTASEVTSRVAFHWRAA